jgi:hypothetical protein
MNARHTQTIIEQLGGASVVARALGLSPGTVSRWYMPLPRGRGGVVPSKHIKTLCELAQKQDIFLEPNMFFNSVEADKPAAEVVW